jgi:hypothetical protein
VTIDVATGELHFDQVPFVIGPSLKLRPFRKAAKRGPWTERSPNRGYIYASTKVDVRAEPFFVELGFEGSKLTSVSLTVAGDRFGPTWSEAEIEGRRRFHDQWLEAELGTEGQEQWHPDMFPVGGITYKFPWGEVGSYVHMQDMSPIILVSYDSRST